MAIVFADRVPQWAFLAASASQNIPSLNAYPRTSACRGSIGSVSYQHIDNNEDDVLNDGDAYRIVFDNCGVAMMANVVDGTILVEVAQLVVDGDTRTLKLIADYTAMKSFSFNPVDIPDKLRIEYKVSEYVDSMTITPFSRRFRLPEDQDQFTFSDFIVSKTLDRTTASWRIDVQGSVESTRTKYPISFESGSFLSGRFAEYPVEGAFNMAGRGASYILRPKFPLTASEFEFVINDEIQFGSRAWTSFPGFFAWNPYYIEELKLRNISDTFELMYTMPFASDDRLNTRLPVNHTAYFQFNRQVADIVYGDVFYTVVPGPGAPIAADINFNGAVVTIQPAQQLAHGVTYSVNGGAEVIDESGNSASLGGYQVETFDTVDAVVSPKVTYGIAGQLLVLDGSGSSAELGIDQYAWSHSAGSIVEISEPFSPVTHVTLPSSLDPEQLSVVFTVTDSIGEFDSATVPITVFPSVESVRLLYVDSPPSGNGVGQRQFIVSSVGHDVSVSVNSLERVTVAFNEFGDGWRVRIGAPQNQRLEVGKYFNADSLSSEDQERPIFYLDGAAFTCGPTDFEVLSVEYREDGQIDSLALDFIQTCGGSSSQTGFIRIGIASE